MSHWEGNLESKYPSASVGFHQQPLELIALLNLLGATYALSSNPEASPPIPIRRLGRAERMHGDTYKAGKPSSSFTLSSRI